MDADILAARLPSILWIELTSKCPFDCVFCSRKSLRRAGRHMDLTLYRRILAQLDRPATIRLNYSGESIHYPHIGEAVRLAKQSGATVEMVTALASASEPVLLEVLAAGLDRLSVSLHTLRDDQFRELYRFSTLDSFRRNLDVVLANRGATAVDVAFVAMRSNLDQLVPVARYAAERGIPDVSVHPVIQRDPLPRSFDEEQTPAFLERVREAAAAGGGGVVVARPAALPCADLTAGPAITTCEQNPWETIHILSNGDVVVCEVQEHTVMGNLESESLSAVWQGAKYREFRRRYLGGTDARCSGCMFRKAAAMGEYAIEPKHRGHPQLVRGWYTDNDEAALWSRSRSMLVLRRESEHGRLYLRGVLPAGSLTVRCDDVKVGRVAKPGEFEVTMRLPSRRGPQAAIAFEASKSVCPAQSGSPDTRVLGFALFEASMARQESRRVAGALTRLTRYTDRWTVRGLRPRPLAGEEGISVVIPERGNPGMLGECLDALHRSLGRLREPFAVRVVVNGTAPEAYDELRNRFSAVQFDFHAAALGFSRAVARGLSGIRHEWVYLLNSDMLLEPEALERSARLRAPGVFAIGSRIRMQDGSATETNWTAMRFEQGIVQLEELDPNGDGIPQSSLYCGGGCSLFQTNLLRQLVRQSKAYDPFYWEDVEWGVRASRMGYQCLFCPDSAARHLRQATIRNYFGAEEVERIFERNRLLFQFRNVPEGSDPGALEIRLARSDRRTLLEFALRLPESLAVRMEACGKSRAS